MDSVASTKMVSPATVPPRAEEIDIAGTLEATDADEEYFPDLKASDTIQASLRQLQSPTVRRIRANGRGAPLNAHIPPNRALMPPFIIYFGTYRALTHLAARVTSVYIQ
jgi:hypothetical protein